MAKADRSELINRKWYQFEILLPTDAVEKLGDLWDEAPFESFLTVFYASFMSQPHPVCSLAEKGALCNTPHVMHAAGSFGRGRQRWLASVLRFCAMAPRWNSSRAPVRPRRRMRSKR